MMRAVALDRGFSQWLGVILITLICLGIQGEWNWISDYPDEFILPFSDWLNTMMYWTIEYFGWFFMGISWFLEWPIWAMQKSLNGLPWAVTVFLFCVISYVAAGLRLAAFTLCATLYMVIMGYWEESMNSLSLVAISVPLAILVGFGLGAWGFFSKRAERLIMPSLDLLQTIPAFAYLLPILLLFGFGTVVGLIASVLYSFPPMVRNTIVGLRNVTQEVIESGLMSGATPQQLFWQVRVPLSRKQIMLGVNQTMMASLSMVIIASIIGGTADIGWEVLSTIRKAQFGESLLVGIVIALMAMVIDRVTTGLVEKSDPHKPRDQRRLDRIRIWQIAVVGAIVLFALAQAFTPLSDWPRELIWSPAKAMNDGLTYLIVNFRLQIQAVKTFAFFFVMLPAKIGLQEAVSPFTWGFALTFAHKVIYAVVMTGMAALCVLRGRQTLAVLIALLAIFLFVGLTNMPWPSVVLIYGLAGYQIGGRTLGIGTALGFGFMAATGNWTEAMLSIYLCGIAVIIAFAFGTTIGIWAAHNNRVSAFMRPINDTMQTMPLFVILIPFVMIFKIGEFTGLLAIIAYAFVPAIRYAEHSLRNMPENVIEAATMIGATKWQLLWQVKLPLAMPVMMLGLNQTIMYGIAMLVIAALVGTNGLEQIVYIGLSDGDFGVGIIAGLGMAIIAIIADRMTHAWSRKRQAALGLKVN
jgi:glycine betaine/proline transport system permease protein